MKKIDEKLRSQEGRVKHKFSVLRFDVPKSISSFAALNIPKCQTQSDDGECMANCITYLIRNGNSKCPLSDFDLQIESVENWVQIILYLISEFHDLDLPEFDPYRLQSAWEFNILNRNAPINFIARNTNSSTYGMENIKVTQVK